MTGFALPRLWVPPALKLPSLRRDRGPSFDDLVEQELATYRDRVLGQLGRALGKDAHIVFSGYSNYLELKIIDHVQRKTSFTAPTNYYIALCTATVLDTDTGSTITEAAYTGYARLSLPAADLSAASAGESHNTAVETFANCTASSSTVTSWCTLDASTTGNVLLMGTVSSTTISTTNQPASIPASGYSHSLD